MESFITPLISIPRRRPIACCEKSRPAARRLSLPTFRERRYLQEMHIERAKGRPTKFASMETFNLLVWPLTVTKPQDDRFAYSFAKFMKKTDEICNIENDRLELGHGHATNLSLMEKIEDSYLDEHECLQDVEDGGDPELRPQPIHFDIPKWAYVVRARAPKNVLGKRAVQRNRAKRRIRAAAAQIMPNHANRGYEYIFSAFPESLTSPFSVILEDVEQSLRKTHLWADHLSEEELRRTLYCKR